MLLLLLLVLLLLANPISRSSARQSHSQYRKRSYVVVINKLRPPRRRGGPNGWLVVDRAAREHVRVVSPRQTTRARALGRTSSRLGRPIRLTLYHYVIRQMPIDERAQ